jgi:aminopeptidase N
VPSLRRAAVLPALLVSVLSSPAPALAQELDVVSRPLREERSREVDVEHYRIELSLREEDRSFRGRTTITFSSLRDRLRRVRFDAETFVVRAVTSDEGAPLTYTQGDGALEIELPRSLSYGEKTSVTVAYDATNVDVDPEKYGMSKGYDLGLDFKGETADHPALINTLSFPEGARHWFPCYDHPNDRATQETIVTVRDDYRVLSNGRLVETRVGPEAGTRTWVWSQDLPHPTYLFVLVAGPYVVLNGSKGDLPIDYWVYAKDERDALRSFGKTPEILDFFAEEFGYPFPWAKYDQITIPGIGGGAESTTATVIAESTIHDEAAEQDFPSDDLVAHEAAHQWWGNLVSYRDWSETWLSESFATYAQYLFTRHDRGDDEAAVDLLDKKNAYLREARERYQRPIVSHHWRYPNDNFDRHTYQKGAVVLSMLRWIVGDEPFRRTMSRFLEANAYQPVDTHDLMKAIKESTGRDLDWFFDQWVFRPGHPRFEVSCEYDRPAKKLRLRVRQTQDTSGDVPVFRTPVDVAVVTPSGKSVEPLSIEEKDESYALDVSEPPLLVRFDEGNHLLKEWTFEKSLDELLYQLGHDDVLGRMWAASELHRFTGDARARDALAEAARSDSFWAVRESALDALGGGGVPIALDFLRVRSLDPSSRVRAAALRWLGAAGGPERVPFLKERFRLDTSYLARSAALRSMGALGTPADLPFLEEAARSSSPADRLRRAANEAIAAVRGRF